jgi:hypothetical protein
MLGKRKICFDFSHEICEKSPVLEPNRVSAKGRPRVKLRIAILSLLVSSALAVAAQTKSPPVAPTTGVSAQSNAQFFAATDQVLAVMSKILDLPAKAPLKKSIRTKSEIRAYLVAEQKKDEPANKQYADQRTLEAFGLIPQGFPLESFMLNLLTNQVAGLYDPKQKEFFIADWISPEEQKPVMAHELTHALDDQYFHLDKWQRAAEANDDASLARDAVVEGSAVASMLDYSLVGLHLNVRQLPDIAPFIESGVAGQMNKDPDLAKAPRFIRDELLFPYLDGAVFTQQFLKANSGWADFKEVFEHPPTSTQQILHPKLYFQHVNPQRVDLPRLGSAIPHGWRKLDENVVGEFALCEILKQFTDADTAERYAAMWRGDRYAVFENKQTKQTLLVVLYRLDNASDAEQFFPVYWNALERKYGVKLIAPESSEFGSFGNAFFRCVQDNCLSVEGADRPVFEKIVRELKWPPEDNVLRNNNAAILASQAARASRVSN